MHQIHHEARIHRENVAKAADARVAVPRLECVAPWRRERGPRQLWQAPGRRSRGLICDLCCLDAHLADFMPDGLTGRVG
jgi:hypothetical protein